MYYRFIILFTFLFTPFDLLADTLKNSFFYYTVKPSNTLSHLIKYLNTSKAELLKYNKATTLKHFYNGSTIKIPIHQKIILYKIKPKDTLTGISHKFRISMDVLNFTISPKVKKNMWVGSIIAIPLNSQTSTHSKSESTKKKIYQQKKSPKTSSALKKQSFSAKKITYAVQKGDTFYSLAHRFHISVKEVQKYYDKPTLISGTKLYLPTPPASALPPSEIKKNLPPEKKDPPTASSFESPNPNLDQTHTNNIPASQVKTSGLKTSPVPLPEKSKKTPPKKPEKPKNTSNENILSPPPQKNISKKNTLNHPLKENKKPANKDYPLNHKYSHKYSSLVLGLRYKVSDLDKITVKAPLDGKIIKITAFYNFGQAIIIQNQDTQVILASKGFDIFLVKKNQKVSLGKGLATLKKNYSLYFFKINNNIIVKP